MGLKKDISCVVEGRVGQCAYDPDILKSGQESGRSPRPVLDAP